MRIKVGEIDLIQRSSGVPGGEQKLRSINSLSIKDKRKIVELHIMGSDGNVLQETGPQPAEITLEGELYGADVADVILSLHKLYDSGKSQSIQSDIPLIHGINKVSISSFDVKKTTGTEMHYGYSMQLLESSD